MRDPKMVKVGKGAYVCAECGEPLNEVTVKNLDPFCSTSCAHAYHGVVIQTNPTGRGTPVGSSS